LKGGDPFVFGRGGEEALALIRAGIPCEVVPGVTSGTAVPALAGIPLTHRGIAGSAAFLTAHDLAGTGAGPAVRERLSHLARGAETLVLFMAGAELVRVKETLLTSGLAGSTPAALIESGSMPEQQVTLTTLADLDAFDGPSRGGPILVVIGRTVALCPTLRQVAGRGQLPVPVVPAAHGRMHEEKTLTPRGPDRAREPRTPVAGPREPAEDTTRTQESATAPANARTAARIATTRLHTSRRAG
jgi:hypothetical protein